MKRTLILFICLICCLCLICACGKKTVDTTNESSGTDTEETIGNTEATDSTDTDYYFNTPGSYIPDDTDDPNIFIEISPIDNDDKWGKLNIKPE